MGNTNFIARATKHKGKLRKYVENEFGSEGFKTHDGRKVIKKEVLDALKKGKVHGHKVSTRVQKEAVLAETLERMHPATVKRLNL